MKKFLLRVLRWGAVLLLLVVAAIVVRAVYVFRDRVPGYSLD